MQLSNDASAIAEAEVADYFIYYGRWGEIIPWDVTHVKIHSSVRAIKDRAFRGRGQVVTVFLNDGLEEIGEWAFERCTSLERIVIPNSVKTIKNCAFFNCSRLTTADLGGGLEEIGVQAFYTCTSLEQIVIPNAVKMIKNGAFRGCSRLTTADLGEGLDEIGVYAFNRCTSLQRIVIPPTVKTIGARAFGNCSGLTTVQLGNGLEEIEEAAFERCTALQRIFIPPAVRVIDDRAFYGCSQMTNVACCAEIEEFVSCEAMRHWWTQGVHGRSLSTYCFLVKFTIPERLGLVQVPRWRANVYDMLRRIPSIRPKGMNSFFVSIDSRLSFYEILKESPALLELAIWKSKITERTGHNILLTTETKMRCRTDSVTMVNIIVPNVMSFLTDGDDWSDEDNDNETECLDDDADDISHEYDESDEEEG